MDVILIKSYLIHVQNGMNIWAKLKLLEIQIV